MAHRVGTSNAFGALEDTMAKKCSDGTNLIMTREKYECGVNSIMNDKSLRGPEGRLKLVAKMKDHIKSCHDKQISVSMKKMSQSEIEKSPTTGKSKSQKSPTKSLDSEPVTTSLPTPRASKTCAP